MTTWKPVDEHGELDAAAKNKLPDSAYAFAKARKEPLTDAKHVRNAIARFDQVQDVTDAERDDAFANIQGGGQALRCGPDRDVLARAGQAIALTRQPRVSADGAAVVSADVSHRDSTAR